MIAEVRKQVPTPMNKVIPNEAQPRNMEKPNEPNANMVVSEVSNIAFPVLEKTVCIFFLPSCRQRWMICTPSSMPIPMIMGRPIKLTIFNFIPNITIIPTIHKTPQVKGIIARMA